MRRTDSSADGQRAAGGPFGVSRRTFGLLVAAIAALGGIGIVSIHFPGATGVSSVPATSTPPGTTTLTQAGDAAGPVTLPPTQAAAADSTGPTGSSPAAMNFDFGCPWPGCSYDGLDAWQPGTQRDGSPSTIDTADWNNSNANLQIVSDHALPGWGTSTARFELRASDVLAGGASGGRLAVLDQSISGETTGDDYWYSMGMWFEPGRTLDEELLWELHDPYAGEHPTAADPGTDVAIANDVAPHAIILTRSDDFTDAEWSAAYGNTPRPTPAVMYLTYRIDAGDGTPDGAHSSLQPCSPCIGGYPTILQLPIAPVVLGQWNKLMIHIVFAEDGDGAVQVWDDNSSDTGPAQFAATPNVSYTGPTMKYISGSTDGYWVPIHNTRLYMMDGIYRGTVPPGVAQVMYFTGVRRRTSHADAIAAFNAGSATGQTGADSSASTYANVGTVVNTFDANGVVAWSGLSVDASTPSGTGVMISAQSSPDQQSWSPSVTVSCQGSLTDCDAQPLTVVPADRYLRYTATLEGDGKATATLASASLTYAVAPPVTPPTSFTPLPTPAPLAAAAPAPTPPPAVARASASTRTIALTPVNLAANSRMESDPGASYATSGKAVFEWATGQVHSGGRSLRIVSTRSSVARWLTRAPIPVTPGVTYTVSAWLKSNGGRAALGTAFVGTRSAHPLGGVQQLDTAHGWTKITVQTTAPAHATSLKVEFSLDGPGTLWADDLTVTRD